MRASLKTLKRLLLEFEPPTLLPALPWSVVISLQTSSKSVTLVEIATSENA